jgi:hypothetical protein
MSAAVPLRSSRMIVRDFSKSRTSIGMAAPCYAFTTLKLPSPAAMVLGLRFEIDAKGMYASSGKVLKSTYPNQYVSDRSAASRLSNT